MADLETRYNGVFGTKTSKGQLYGGFYLLIAGIVLGLAALILFFIANAKTSNSESFYNWREGALAVGSAGLVGIFLGISIALPTKTSLRIASLVGTFLCVFATVLFIIHYPTHFNVKGSGQTDYTALDTGVYAVGMALLVSAVFASIIAYYLTRLQPTTVGEDADDDESYGPGYEVPDWVVERDIEYAMKRHGVSWGDGKGGSGSSSLVINIPDTLGGGAVIGGLGKAKTVQLDSEQVDAGVSQLTQVRPSKKPTIPGQWADESTSALRALRQKQQDKPSEFVPKSERPGFWRRFWNSVTGRKSGGSAAVAPKLSQANLNPVQPPVNLPKKKGKTIIIEDEK